MKHLSKSILIPRSIAPNGSILYEPNFFKFRIENTEPISWFTLAIDYHTVLDGKDFSFNSVFRLALRMDELTEGVYKPTSILRLEGEFSDDELERILGFRTNFKRWLYIELEQVFNLLLTVWFKLQTLNQQKNFEVMG